MQKEYLIELSDAVIAAKDANGRVKLNQLLNTTAAGAVSGTFWGTLIGLIFLMPLAGAALGAASGARGGALTDVGINDKWMKEAAAVIQPALQRCLLVREATADKVPEGLKGEGGTVMKTLLDRKRRSRRRWAGDLELVRRGAGWGANHQTTRIAGHFCEPVLVAVR